MSPGSGRAVTIDSPVRSWVLSSTLFARSSNMEPKPQVAPLVNLVNDALLDPKACELMRTLTSTLDELRTQVLAARQARRAQLAAGEVSLLEATAHIRSTKWTVDPLPLSMQARRVELLGGCSQLELVQGLNSGAMSYVADLWNLSATDTKSVLEAHHNLIEAAHHRSSVSSSTEGDQHINASSTTRLMFAPRPLQITEPGVQLNGAPVCATIFDLVLFCVQNGRELVARQQGVLLYLRHVEGHLEARYHDRLFDLLEEHLDLPRGTIRATVMLDSISASLEIEEILFELSHHSAGVSLDLQAYAADHIALFSGADRKPLPDRETIGLNAPFLRTLSLLAIGAAHRRGAHAIGAPSFVLPPDDEGRLRSGYLEMLADKEREAVDGHDGTLVGHPGLVTAAMVEFNKSMPMAHQLSFQRHDEISPKDLVEPPVGTISVDSLVSILRTSLRALAYYHRGERTVVQGGRLHDRSSVQLAIALLWQWNHSREGVISSSGLEVHEDLLRYLVKKETEKLFAEASPELRAAGKQAADDLLGLVLGDRYPKLTCR